MPTLRPPFADHFARLLGSCRSSNRHSSSYQIFLILISSHSCILRSIHFLLWPSDSYHRHSHSFTFLINFIALSLTVSLRPHRHSFWSSSFRRLSRPTCLAHHVYHSFSPDHRLHPWLPAFASVHSSAFVFFKFHSFLSFIFLAFRSFVLWPICQPAATGNFVRYVRQDVRSSRAASDGQQLATDNDNWYLYCRSFVSRSFGQSPLSGLWPSFVHLGTNLCRILTTVRRRSFFFFSLLIKRLTVEPYRFSYFWSAFFCGIQALSSSCPHSSPS